MSSPGDARSRIISRAAQEIQQGMNVNLGIGLPTLLADVAADTPGVMLQSENGLLGIGPYPAVGDRRSDPRRGIEGGDPGPAGAQLLGERSLRSELDLQLAGEVLALKDLVLADVGADHLGDLTGRQQDAEAVVVDAAVVGDHREVGGAVGAERGDRRLRYARQPEATDDQRRPVGDVGDRLGGVGVQLGRGGGRHGRAS
jgi:hypothetical protein